MNLFSGKEAKKGVILGVANEFSIATGVAKVLHAEGARLAFCHLPDKDGRDRMEKRVRRAIEGLEPALVAPCDLNNDEEINEFFEKVRDVFGKIDFLVHSVAYAPLEDIRCPALKASRDGFMQAMQSSVYTFMATAKAASALMDEGGSIVTMTYFGGEKVVGGYNLMGICKAALEAAVRYLAYDLGPQGIRVNAVSAGPIKTLSASAIGDFSDVLTLNAAISPLGRNVTQEEVGKATAFLLSDLASGTTGENLHVDSGYSIMGSPGHAVERLGIKRPAPATRTPGTSPSPL